VREVRSDSLRALMDAASAIDSPHVDLGPLGIPAKVGVDDLHNVLLTHDYPVLSVDWGGGEVTVGHVDGGVLATLTIRG